MRLVWNLSLIHISFIWADDHQMVIVQLEIFDFFYQSFQELIGREEVVETIQRNCVLNTWVMRIKSDEVGNTHIP